MSSDVLKTLLEMSRRMHRRVDELILVQSRTIEGLEGSLGNREGASLEVISNGRD